MSSSLSLAMLEILVHVDRSRALAEHVVLPVTFDAEDVLVLERDAFPKGWDAPVPGPAVQAVVELAMSDAQQPGASNVFRS